MFAAPVRQEIDHRTIKLVVGLIALSLPCLTSFFAGTVITSISASYYEGGWSQSIFIGFLFAISSFLLAYNGMSRPEMLLSKLAAVAGLGVALFPCGCGGHVEVERIGYVHAGSAAVMFFVLTYFCYTFNQRAKAKGYPQAKLRAAIYATCGFAIFLAIAVLAADKFLLKGALTVGMPQLLFYGEATALIAFGISWLTASRVLPWITRKDERFSPFST